jgi:hypothetical protein
VSPLPTTKTPRHQEKKDGNSINLVSLCLGGEMLIKDGIVRLAL